MDPYTTLTSKNQLTLPKQVRDELDLKPGDRLVFRKKGDSYVIEARKRRSALDFAGALHDARRPALTQQDIKSAGADAAVERYEQTSDRN
ncbi:MAG: AbrB/MazE/SpoVT family DNA-binding domain-containing protein [Mesorhizobium sp.]